MTTITENITEIATTAAAESLDLFYLGRSPYASGDDFSINFANLRAAVLSGAPDFEYLNVTTATQTLVPNTGYISNNAAGSVAYTLPIICAIGDVFEIVGNDPGGWNIIQLAGQTLKISNAATTTGVGGSVTTTNAGDALRFVCVVANLEFRAVSVVGNLTII